MRSILGIKNFTHVREEVCARKLFLTPSRWRQKQEHTNVSEPKSRIKNRHLQVSCTGVIPLKGDPLIRMSKSFKEEHPLGKRETGVAGKPHEN